MLKLGRSKDGKKCAVPETNRCLRERAMKKRILAIVILIVVIVVV